MDIFQKILFDGRGLSDNHQEETKPDATAKISHTRYIPPKHKADVEALQLYCEDSFAEGIAIEMSLQEALEVMPKERRRVDAYDSLAKYLDSEWNIKLTVKSIKTK
ncbi:MAG: hypothetical protein SNI20_04275 [Rikenellaceae bacterium]